VVTVEAAGREEVILQIGQQQLTVSTPGRGEIEKDGCGVEGIGSLMSDFF
jgi:hypothetical protein